MTNVEREKLIEPKVTWNQVYLSRPHNLNMRLDFKQLFTYLHLASWRNDTFKYINFFPSTSCNYYFHILLGYFNFIRIVIVFFHNYFVSFLQRLTILLRGGKALLVILILSNIQLNFQRIVFIQIHHHILFLIIQRCLWYNF